MQDIPIEQVKPEMKLGCRLRNTGGEIIAEAGTPVTEKLISQCNTLGIYTLQILDNPVPGAPRSYDAAQRFERVTYLFRNQQQSIFMRTIEAFLKKHFHERI